jgi:hypothetical protein
MFVIKHRTSTKKKNKQEYSFQEMTGTALLGSARVYLALTSHFADRDRLIGFRCGAAITFTFAFHSESELKGLKVNRTEVKDFLLSILLFLQSIDKSFWNL